MKYIEVFCIYKVVTIISPRVTRSRWDLQESQRDLDDNAKDMVGGRHQYFSEIAVINLCDSHLKKYRRNVVNFCCQNSKLGIKWEIPANWNKLLQVQKLIGQFFCHYKIKVLFPCRDQLAAMAMKRRVLLNERLYFCWYFTCKMLVFFPFLVYTCCLQK